MDADTFVSKLDACCPSRDSLFQASVPSAYAEEVRGRHKFCLKLYPKGNDDPLLDLIGRYETSSVELGRFIFLAAPERMEAGWIVGEVEVDPMIISHQDGSVFVEEYGTNGYVQWECAQDSSSFLEAMSRFACFLIQRTIGKNLHEDQPANRAKAKECAVIAGGDRYGSFYEMLLGCE